jgi:hypothetical protein
MKFFRLLGMLMGINEDGRTRRFRERRTFGFREGTRFGRRYSLRVFLLIAATALLTWYARQGVNNPFATVRSIRVYGGGDGYAAAAVAATYGKAPAVVGEVAVSGGALGGLPPADTSGAAVWREVYPLSDSVRAVLLTYGGMTALACDTAIFAPLRGGAGAVAPQFYEKLDILALPPSNDSNILEARNRFRPRFAVAAPPCKNGLAKNILCAPTGQFDRFFNVKNGKLSVGND